MSIRRYNSTAQRFDVTPITIRRWATDPKYSHLDFPKPVPLGDNSVGFVDEELDAWEEAQAAKRGRVDPKAA